MAPRKQPPPLQWAIKPWETQQEILDYLWDKKLNAYGDPFRFLCAILGRQSGKSLVGKVAIMDSAANQGKRCMWVAPTISASRVHWNQILNWIEKAKYPVKRINRAAKEIEFYSGGYIVVRTAMEPDNLRGDGLHLIVLDEAAFYRNGDYIWNYVIMPMITATKGKILILTTPNGRNWVYPVFKRGMTGLDKYWKSWQVPSWVSPYQDKDLLDEIKANTPSIVFRQEYGAEFITDAGGVFPGADKVALCNMLFQPIQGRIYVAGVDWGVSKDFSCFTVFDITEFPIKQVYAERWNNEGTIKTGNRVRELLELWQPSKAYIEHNGIGKTYYNALRELIAGENLDMIEDVYQRSNEEGELAQYTTYTATMNEHTKLIAVHVDNDVKRELVEQTAAAIEYARVNLLSEDTNYGETQLSEMSTMMRVPTKSGMNITYKAEEGYHDDTVTAVYLASKGFPRPVAVKFKNNNKKPNQVQNPFKKRKRL